MNALALICLSTLGQFDFDVGYRNPVYSPRLCSSAVIDGLTTADSKQRWATSENLTSDLTIFTQALETAVDSKSNRSREEDERRVLAAKALGSIGDRGSLDVLVRNIELVRSSPFCTERSTLLVHPCAWALVTRGQSAAPAIFRHLRNTPPDQISPKAICAYGSVLQAVYADEGGVDEALAVIRRARERSEPRAHQNFDRVIARLERGIIDLRVWD